MYDRASIHATLVRLLEEDTGESFRDVQDADNLREGLGLDSVDVVSVVSQVERRFHIRLSHEELEKLVTFGDVLDLLVRKVNAPQEKAA